MMTGVPLPAALSGTVVERVIRIDSALLYIVNGALCFIADFQRYVAVGGLSEDDARAALYAMLDIYFEGRPTAMIGSIVPFATENLPTGCLPCDGSIYSATDYPELFAVLDSALKISPTEFRTPNLNGRFIRGTDPAGILPFMEGGEAEVVLSIDQIPAHRHEYGARIGATAFGSVAQVAVPSNTGSVVTRQTGSVGGGQAHNNLPPFLALRYGIIAR